MVNNKVLKTFDELVEATVFNVEELLRKNSPIPEIRNQITTMTNTLGKELTSEQKRELGTKLREKFDRHRRFWEAMYTEIVQATGQVGW